MQKVLVPFRSLFVFLLPTQPFNTFCSQKGLCLRGTTLTQITTLSSHLLIQVLSHAPPHTRPSVMCLKKNSVGYFFCYVDIFPLIKQLYGCLVQSILREMIIGKDNYPANIYLFKINNRNTILLLTFNIFLTFF